MGEARFTAPRTVQLAQAMRRFGSRVTVVEQGPQLAVGEVPGVAAAVLELASTSEVLSNR